MTIYVREIVGDNEPTYSPRNAEYKQIGSSWHYIVDLPCNTIGKYSIYFTATKDGYSVTSTPKTLTVTKPNLSNAEITFPGGNEAAFNYMAATGVPKFIVTYNGKELEQYTDFTIISGDSTYDVGSCCPSRSKSEKRLRPYRQRASPSAQRTSPTVRRWQTARSQPQAR